jgi:hypothetical protein
MNNELQTREKTTVRTLAGWQQEQALALWGSGSNSQHLSGPDNQIKAGAQPARTKRRAHLKQTNKQEETTESTCVRVSPESIPYLLDFYPIGQPDRLRRRL